VTGTTQLAHYTGLSMFTWGAVALFIGLLCAWLIATLGTIHGLKHGRILLVPTAAPAVKAQKNAPKPTKSLRTPKSKS
ncbi:MAG: hypothetical protein ACRCT7_13495, partial [Shewanella sp.]